MSTEAPTPQFMTIKEVLRACADMSRDTLIRFSKDPDDPCPSLRRMGGKIVMDRAEFAEWVKTWPVVGDEGAAVEDDDDGFERN